MLPIRKLPPPPGLHQYLRESRAAASYDGFRDYRAYTNANGEDAFFELRSQLLREQMCICAYCGQLVEKVENEKGVQQMKTEHFTPQNGTAANDLHYPNLLGCCMGNSEFGKIGEPHCDSKKGEKHLHHLQNPASLTARDRRIIYKVNPKAGEVIVLAEDDDLNGEINKLLNLNHQRLRSRRFSLWQRLIHPSLESKNELAAIHDSYLASPGTQPKEFRDFVLWYLDKKLLPR